MMSLNSNSHWNVMVREIPRNGLSMIVAALAAASMPACSPVVVANYFIEQTAGERIIGEALQLTNLNSSTGQLVGAFGVREARPGRDSEGYVSWGPYVTVCGIKNELKKKNLHFKQVDCRDDGSERGEALNFRVDFSLASNSNAFAQNPVVTLSVFGTKIANGTSVSRTLRSRKIFPQDFYEGRDKVHVFSFGLADYEADPGEKLEFRIYWHGKYQVMHYGTRIVPAEFRPVYAGWIPFDKSQLRRDYDAHFIQTYYEERNGTLSPLEPREMFYRDTVAGQRGTYPAIGIYDQSKMSILRYQIRQAKAAGISAFRVFNYGRINALENGWQNVWWEHLNKLYQAAALEGEFYISLDLSELQDGCRYLTTHGSGCKLPYRYDEIYKAFKVIVQHGYFDRPATLRQKNEPVIHIPLTYEKDPEKIAKFISELQAIYQSQERVLPYSKTAERLHVLLTTHTVYPVPSMPVTEAQKGIHNMEVGWNGDAHLGLDLFNKSLLEKNPSYQGLPVDSFFEWDAKGISFWKNPNGGFASKDMYTLAVQDLKKFKKLAVVGVKGHHNSSEYRPFIIQPEIPRADSTGLRFRRLFKDAIDSKAEMIWIENWNGFKESVQIEPSLDFIDDYGNKDPDIYLKIIAQALGKTYVPPKAPCADLDPLAVPYFSRRGLCL